MGQMKNLKESLEQLASVAKSQSPETGMGQETLENARSIFALLADQDVLKVLFRNNNRHGATYIKVDLACGVRDDFPAMIEGEEIVLSIWRGEKGLEHCIDGEVSWSNETIGVETSDFKIEGSLIKWLSGYFAGSYSHPEVAPFVPFGSWEARVSRRLTPEILALSHASRLENISNELESMILPKDHVELE